MVQPRKPTTLPTYTEEILTRLAKRPEAAELVLGGHLALKHYLDYRQTHDIDAWWRRARSPQAESQIRTVMTGLADRHGLQLAMRAFGEVSSFELVSEGRKVFSFRIAPRSLYLNDPVLSPWPPLLLESLEDNIASKMNALVNRGAPRDFLDIQRAVEAGLMNVERCWILWRQRNPDEQVRTGREKVLFHLVALETRRPLTQIQDQQEREQAAQTRAWFHERFLLR